MEMPRIVLAIMAIIRPVCTFIGNTPSMHLIFIADVENVEILLKSKDCLNKPHTFYKMIRDGLSADGLFTSNGK